MHIQNKQFFLENIAVYEVAIYGYLISITEEPQLSEDLLQNTMEKAWEKMGQLRESSKVQSWLFSIARNEAKKYYRYQENKYSYIEDIDLNNQLTENNSIHSLDALEYLVRNFDINAMKEALRLLGTKDRKLIIMYYFQGKSQRQIAEDLNQKYSTVRVSLVRALKKVRKILKQIENGEIDINRK